jgi:hypothetical protein
MVDNEKPKDSYVMVKGNPGKSRAGDGAPSAGDSDRAERKPFREAAAVWS